MSSLFCRLLERLLKIGGMFDVVAPLTSSTRLEDPYFAVLVFVSSFYRS